MQKIYSKYLESESTSDRSRSGRQRSISERSRRSIKRIYLEDRMLSTISITRIYNEYSERQISISSVQKILKKYGLNSYMAKKKPYLTGKQRPWRMSWAKDRVVWDVVKWSRIVYSDECIIQTYHVSNRIRIRRASPERNNSLYSQPIMRHGPKIHVWCCFSYCVTGILRRITGNINALKYTTEIYYMT